MWKSKVSYKDKVAAVEKYKRGERSQERIASEFGVRKTLLQQWRVVYESHGAAGLQLKPTNKRYSKELKTRAIQAYLNGEDSQRDICKMYQILSRCQLQNWIAMYNGHNELRATGGVGKGIYMTKGRKTTFDERVEIAAFCIEHSKDYALTVKPTVYHASRFTAG